MALQTVAAQTDAVVADVVARCLRRYPTDAARIVRGAAIAASSRVMAKLGGGRYAVKSCSGQGVYSATAQTCDCPDALGRGAVCKHQWAVAIVEIAAQRRAVLAARAAATATAGVI